MRAVALCIFLFLLILGHNACSQNKDLKICDSLIKLHQFDKVQSIITSNLSVKTNHDKAHLSYLRAFINMINDEDIEERYKLLTIARKNVSKDSLDLRFRINEELIYAQYSSLENPYTPNDLIFENKKIAQQTLYIEHLLKTNTYAATAADPNKPLTVRKAIAALRNSLMLVQNNQEYENKLLALNNNLGVCYNWLEKSDSALYYFARAYKQPYSKQDSLYNADLYNNMAIAYKINRDYTSSISRFEQSLEIDSIYNNTDITYRLPHYAEVLALNGQYKKAASVYSNYVMLTDSLQLIEQDKNIKELEAQYQSAVKDKQILKDKAQKERDRTTIIALGGAGVLLLLSGIFIYHNQRKRVLLERQQKELETQRADTLYKEQELKTIDALISGQEQERKRLASELHDNLGSSLTTLRLYLNSLDKKVTNHQARTMLAQTEIVLNDTYTTVRNMSHERGSSILSSQGLIPTLEQLGEQIQKTGAMQFEIVHNGEDLHLNNTVELALFRTLQELINNIVKHSKATEASINITTYVDSLNFTIEDNGIGFDLKTTKSKEGGYGLRTIEQRIEKLGGSLEVDSTPNRGTTIHLEIPLA